MKRRRSKSYKKFREVGIGLAIFFIIVGICVAIIFSIWGVRTSYINDKFDNGKVISHPGAPGSQKYSFIDNVPVRVMSIGRPDRKANMEDLLEKFEFKNVGFSDCLYQKKDINKNRLLNEGKITKNCFSEWDSEIAHTLGYLESLKKYGDKTKGLFFLEDDLMILKPLEECQRQLQNAFDALPESADMLYFEMGGEDCKNLKFRGGSPIVEAIHPWCTAAIYFTPKGIDKVLDLCQPIFQTTDVMFRDLIKKGKLEAYISIPLVFHQDNYWGSDLRKEAKGHEKHSKNNKPCGLF